MRKKAHIRSALTRKWVLITEANVLRLQRMVWDWKIQTEQGGVMDFYDFYAERYLQITY